jgi:signal transduction histidine kinase
VAANLTKDSTEKAANKRQLQELVAKYEIQTKEQQIKLLQQEAQIKDQANRFWLVGGVLVLLSVLGLAAWLLNRAKYRRLQESLHLRHKIATDLHDEIGSTLSSISLLSGLTQKQLANEQPQKVAQMVAKINTDARHILESMDDIVWAINPRNDAMTQLLTRLREYAKPLAESKEIRLEFVASPQAESISLPLQVRQNVYLIAKEALNNAFKYAEATKINVEFEVKNDKLTATITDNGVGFETEVLTSRNGLKNMKTRAEEIKATFSIHSHPKEGTKIQLSLKV